MLSLIGLLFRFTLRPDILPSLVPAEGAIVRISANTRAIRTPAKIMANIPVISLFVTVSGNMRRRGLDAIEI
jgi:hypothetical protein